MARPLFAGLDVGTNATKCLICDGSGRVMAQSRRDYDLSHPRQGWVEQDAEDLWRAVLAALQEAVSSASGAGEVRALSLAAQGGTTIPVGPNMRPLRPAISWLDARAAAEGKELVAGLGQDYIYNATGWEANTALSLLHIAWLRKHEPETFAKARHYLFVNDFVLYRLTGSLLMDPSDAAMTLLYNVERGEWDGRLCAVARIAPEQLSPLAESGQPAGTLLPEVAAAVGLSPNAVVVNGGHDQYCASLGTGATSPGDVMLSCGTAWVLLATAGRLIRDPSHVFAPGRHVLPGAWGLLSSMPAAGASMEWLARNVISGPEDTRPRYDLLDEHLSDTSAGASGLLFLPYLAGIEAATRQTGLWGTLTGLTLGHSRWDIARALMEGVALELRWILAGLRHLDYLPQFIYMVGGASRSRFWPRIVADVTGVPLVLPQVPEAAARGAAILAAMGAGLWEKDGGQPAGAHRVEPQSENAPLYGELYERFRELDRRLRGKGEPNPQAAKQALPIYPSLRRKGEKDHPSLCRRGAGGEVEPPLPFQGRGDRLIANC